MRRILKAISRFFSGSFLLLGLGSLAWLILRSGEKPSRLRYPCQQAAAGTGAFWLSAFALPGVLRGLRHAGLHLPELKLSRAARYALVGLGLAIFAGIVAQTRLRPRPAVPAPAGAGLGVWVSAAPTASHVFVVDSMPAPDSLGLYHEGLDSLFALLAQNGVALYKSARPLPWCDTAGIVGRDDVVLIKVNAEWPERGMTNTDLIKGLIARIVAHPDTFTGEIELVENGQWRHSWAYPLNNAERQSQTMQQVVDLFAGQGFRVGAYNWTAIGYSGNNRWVSEYDQGDTVSGYIREDSTGMTYAKFTTAYGTRISTRLGPWNGSAYEPGRLKFFNLPVLKSHSIMGVTGATKHYIGFLSYAAIGAGTMHARAMTQGLLGVELGKARFPDLNIIDATWSCAEITTGPSAPYSYSTRLNTLVASRDPIAADWYAGGRVLRPASWWGGHAWLRNYGRMDPDNQNTENPGSGRLYSDSTPCNGNPYNAFHQLLAGSRDQLRRYGRQVTMDSSEITVHHFRFTPVGVERRGDARPAQNRLELAPSPSNGRAVARLAIDRPGPVRLAVFTADGRQVAAPAPRYLAAGEHELTIDRALAAGTYLVAVETPAGRLQGRLVVAAR